MANVSSAIAASPPQPLPRIFPASEIVPAVEKIIARFEKTRDSMLNNLTLENASFDTVLRPVAEVENETIGELGVIWMLQYGAPDMVTQDAVAKARQLFIKSEATCNTSSEMYKLLQAVNDIDKTLDAKSKLLLDKTLLEYKLSGCGIVNKDEKMAFTQQSLELDNLLTKAQRNISQESGGVCG